MHAQQAALAFHERRALIAFVTGLVFGQNGIDRVSTFLPNSFRARVRKELSRRTVTQVPTNLVISYPWLDALRISLGRIPNSPIYADMVWDIFSRRFDRRVARRHLGGVQAVYAFEYTAKSTFEQARRDGVATILALPAIDNKEFTAIKAREESRFPELRARDHRYFERRFSRRYDRMRQEIELADVIVANSEMTKQSHVRSGTDPGKIAVVPLGAPRAIDEIMKPSTDIFGPLSIVVAGNISIGKGTHYFLDAWRMLRAGNQASAFLYGRVGLPESTLRPAPDGIEMKGSVPQQELFAAFDRADVLVFPTLADGFGMVITEALARGLPVITTDQAGGSDLIEHGRNGLVIPAADSAALVDALRWCLDNRWALYGMRFRALETARRWQWPDHRRMLIGKISEGLQRAGHRAEFETEISLFDFATVPERCGFVS